MAFVDPLGGPSPLPGMHGPLRSRSGIDVSLADKRSTGSNPSLFVPPRGRLRLVELVLLLLLRRVRPGERVGECSNFKKIPTHTQDHGDA